MRITALNIWYTYPGSKEPALRGVSLELRGGTITGLTGSNGSGKTTLLKIMGLLYKPSKGEILIDGFNPWTSGSLNEHRKMIVYVHETPIILRGTVLDNLTVGLKIRGIPASEAKRLARELARDLGICSLLQAKAQKLSRGFKQLLSIARALLVKPKILLLDEPFNSLDRKKKKRLIEVLETYKNNDTTIMISTHDTLLLAQIAEKTLLIEEGRIINPDHNEPG